MKTTNAGENDRSEYDVKLQQRRFRWRWNTKLLVGSAIGSLVLLLLAMGSYFYNSATTASTFLKLAETAKDQDDFVEQAKWLKRYTLLAPEDVEVVYEMAIATDQAATHAERSTLAVRVNAARKSLSGAIARIGETDETKVSDLRRRLIARLLQSGASWNREAEQQIIALDAPEDDPQALSFLARALSSQLNDGSFQQRKHDAILKSDSNWGWMSNQQVGFVIGQALRKNPDDVDLVVSFLFTSKSHPDQFKSDSQVASLSAAEQRELGDQAIAMLQANSTSRAKLALYRYLQDSGRDQQASEVLSRVADQAFARLQSGLDSNSDDSPSVESVGHLSEYWDFLAVYEAARQSQAARPDQSTQRYRFLISLDIKSISGQQREDVYLAAGNLLVAENDTDAALETWQEGLEKANGGSILLLQAISQTYVTRREFKEAKKTVSQLSDAIESASLRLFRATDVDMILAERIAIGRRLDTARWHLGVLNGYVATENRPLEAIGFFRDALRSDADVAAAEKISCCVELAKLFGHQGSWDQAAAVLDQARLLDPKNPSLSRLAVEAWTKSGNQAKAIQQWSFIGGDSSLESLIASLEARLHYQLRLLPERRDVEDIRFDIRQLRKNLQQQFEAAAESDETVQRRLISGMRYIEALQLTIPSGKVAASGHLLDAEKTGKIDQLAKQHPDDARLQVLAAEKLAKADQRDLAMAALQRLAEIQGTTQGFVLVKARVLALLGDQLEAAKFLIEQTHVNPTPVSQTPVTQTQPSDLQDAMLLQTAAGFAVGGGDVELAFQALNQISEYDHTLSSLFAITGLAKRLPTDSRELSLSGQQVSADQLSQHWADQLRRREGESGTYWRLHQALDLLSELQGDARTVDNDDPRLTKSQELVGQILALRPRWGDAISLGGWISVIQGDAEKAVSQLRRGIAAGDSRLKTRRLLWEQLISLGRGAEAEREIRLASLGSQFNLDRYSAARIDLAIRQGDFSKSMRVATESAKRRPEDVLAHLVVATTGTTALRNVRVETQRKSFLLQTRQAITMAKEIAGADDARVLSASLRLAFALDDFKLVEISMQEIQNSKVDEPTKNRLLGQAHVAMKQYDQALPRLVRVDQLKPSSASQLSLAELYRLLERPKDEIKALRMAQQRDGANDKLRNLLAQKLVAQSADGKPLDWNEIGELLSGSDGVVASNRLMHAVLLGSEGLRELKVDSSSTAAQQRLRQSKSSLRDLVKDQSRKSDDAARYLAMLLQQQGKLEEGISEREQTRLDSEVRVIYESLYNRGQPQSTDLYRYASYLLDQDDQADNAKIGNLISKLNSTAGGTLQCLEVGIRFADRKGDRSSTPSIVSEWASRALGTEDSGKQTSGQPDDRAMMVFAAAGSSLLKLGFAEDSIEWFDRAYQERPETLGAYIVALVKAQETEKAMEVCIDHFDKHHDASSAKLFLELLLGIQDAAQQADLIRTHSELVKDAVKRFEGDVGLLEGVGTLRMAQGEFESATKIFQKVLKKDPLRIRALNNLAMALAEIPGRASEGIAPINTALELGNQNPELLDTKGVVLMASGKISEAEDTFASAFLESKEPRHLFHQIVAQLIQGKDRQAEKTWKRLDLKALDPTGLTPTERKKLQKMKKKFGSRS